MNKYRASFVGSGSEYFRIWAVNITLTLLTFSLYRPWAKVRRLQYFARNIRLADASLDYHGQPLAIFKGQLLVYVLLGIANLEPMVAAAASFLGVMLLPWVLQRSLGFRMRNTSYRGLRFGFDAPVKAFYTATGLVLVATIILAVVFLIMPRAKDTALAPALAIALSFFFALLPVIMVIVVMSIRFKSIPYTHWGNRRFGSTLGNKAIWRMLGFIALLSLGLLILVALMAGAMTSSLMLSRMASASWLFILLAISLMTGFKALIGARLHNRAWNDTQLGHDRFSSDLSEWRYAMSSIGVFWMSLLTLGLYRPFGLIKLARMQVESVVIHTNQSIEDTLASNDVEQVSAFGQEAADWFDIDIAF